MPAMMSTPQLFVTANIMNRTCKSKRVSRRQDAPDLRRKPGKRHATVYKQPRASDLNTHYKHISDTSHVQYISAIRQRQIEIYHYCDLLQVISPAPAKSGSTIRGNAEHTVEPDEPSRTNSGTRQFLTNRHITGTRRQHQYHIRRSGICLYQNFIPL